MNESAQPKWRRRADDRPDEVLDAALRLFVRKGFAATKVEDIAHAAGLSKGAIYRYFSSKEEIFESLVKRALTPLADRTSLMARTSRDDAATIIKMVLTMMASGLADPDTLALPRLVLMEAGSFPALAAAYRRQVIDKAISALETTVERGIDEGTFRSVNARLAVRNIIGPMLAHVLLSQIFGIGEEENVKPMDFVESHFDILIHGLAAQPLGD